MPNRDKPSFVGRFALCAIGLTLAIVGAVLAGDVAAVAGSTDQGRVVPAVVAHQSETAKVSFMGSMPGAPITRPAGLPSLAAPAAVARAFLDRRGTAFGIRDQAHELRVSSVRELARDRSSVRFRQLHDGVPVIGGELVVNLDAKGNVLSAAGEVTPAPDVSVAPRVTAAAARDRALEMTARAHGVRKAGLRAGDPILWIYDSRLMGGPGLDRPTLVWRINVTGRARMPVNELVLVDAQLGVVALHFSQIETAKVRRVCDAQNTDAQVPCTNPARSEGGPASKVKDVNDAYDLTGAVHDFLQRRFGRDSIDGAGETLTSTARWCPQGWCPFDNAYWDGKQMVFGQGYASADDVVGHELTHGLIDRSSRLFYYSQSGAINESMADVFGEFVDLTDGVGTDTSAKRWRLGEDLPIGAIRDMKDPTRFGDPDRVSSPRYTADPFDEDNGGVHTNSGVNNKAAYLITDGGKFNGETITGLGIDKAARIYYEVVTNLLTSASDYRDLYYALPQACRQLVGTAGITSSDCEQVVRAVNAVEMFITGPAIAAGHATSCPAVSPTQTLYSDDLERPQSGDWTLQKPEKGTNTWYYPQNPNPYFDATFATSGHTNFFGYDQATPADYSIAMTRSIPVPAGAVYLRFNHAYSFGDAGFGAGEDGGVVEYSTDAGHTWKDAGSLLTVNGYNGTLGSSGNPLFGRRAFVRQSKGYGSSRATLAPLAGKSVRFRFRIGAGESFGPGYGWFVDDIRIYSCTYHPPNTRIEGPSTVRAGKRTTWTFRAVDAASDDQSGVFHYQIDWNSDGRWDATLGHEGMVRLSHTYGRAGRVKITAKATDNDGDTGRTAAKAITVRPRSQG